MEILGFIVMMMILFYVVMFAFKFLLPLLVVYLIISIIYGYIKKFTQAKRGYTDPTDDPNSFQEQQFQTRSKQEGSSDVEKPVEGLGVIDVEYTEEDVDNT